jgi:hypothetical protein
MVRPSHTIRSIPAPPTCATVSTADALLYVVVPTSLVNGGPLRRGGLAWIWNTTKRNTAPAVMGDVRFNTTPQLRRD